MMGVRQSVVGVVILSIFSDMTLWMKKKVLNVFSIDRQLVHMRVF